jgi:NAD(P)-dependent dehydrogenase (short-subunit alcohol dehydrogenase family)
LLSRIFTDSALGSRARALVPLRTDQEERVLEGLEGKTALVTGGAGGIGLTICEALLESGGRVFLHDLPISDGASKARSLCQRFGDGRAIFVAGDLNDLAALKRESAALAAEVNGFDFLVNNAAIDPVAPIEAYSIDDFLAVQTINAHAAFVLCQTLAPHMKRKGAGAIVNVMSVVLSGGWAEKVPYAMSKGELLGLTRSWRHSDRARAQALSRRPRGFRSMGDRPAILAVPFGHPRCRRHGALSAFAAKPIHDRAGAACERRHVYGLRAYVHRQFIACGLE